jgi:AcrR family transcriptional regulator
VIEKTAEYVRNLPRANQMLPKSTFCCQDACYMALATKKRYHHGNLRAVLIQAGLELIAEKGVRALTLREIGARVGVSRMAAYRHFADKAKLLAAIREVGFEKFAAALEEGREKAAPEFSARMNGMGVAYVRFARDHAAYFEVMFSTPPTGEPEEACEAEKRAFQILEESIVEGQVKGELRAGDPRLMACAAWSLVHGISALKLDRLPFAQGLEQSEFVIACSNLLWTGVLATKK